jgi:hypothetical protein
VIGDLYVGSWDRSVAGYGRAVVSSLGAGRPIALTVDPWLNPCELVTLVRRPRAREESIMHLFFEVVD